MKELKPFIAQAPGRVFLFGEHSDYLGLEVISMALDRSIKITVNPREDRNIFVKYTDFNEEDSFNLDDKIEYRNKRDYLRSCFNIIQREGIKPHTGANLTIEGQIPIAAGLSSSSALSNAVIMVVAKLAGKKLTKEQIVYYAFKAEVTEFGESGGMMDHFSSAFGGIIHVDFGEKISLTELPVKLKGIIIGDSEQKKKDTVGDLRMIRTTVEKGYKILGEIIPNFSHRKTSLEEILKHSNELPKDCQLMTITTIRNRDLTRKALSFFKRGISSEKILGQMIDEEHLLLRDGFKRSTKKIEKIISAAKKAGALGCKINGSGGGGTILAFAPGREDKVSEAIKEAGGIPYKMESGKGATILPFS